MTIDRGGSKLIEKLRLFGIDQASHGLFPAISRTINRFGMRALGRLYEHIRQDDAMRAYFSSDAAMQHAQSKQQEHWSELFSRPIDAAYLARAERIGQVHSRIGLPPSFYIGGYAQILGYVLPRMLRWSPLAMIGHGSGRRAATVLVQTALLDMDIALSAYFQAEQAGRAAVVTALGNALGRLATGDFTVNLDRMPAGYEALVADFDAMRASICGTLTQVSDAAHHINTGSFEISNASDDLAHRTEQQASTLEETAAAMEQITATIRASAGAAAHANDAVLAMKADIEESGSVVGLAVEAMQRIEASSSKITDIIAVIDGIAFQTNLLALNAGVEAARAGDLGKGFAVVANEVRALAQRSAEAARDVKLHITTSSEQIQAGVALVARSGTALDRVVGQIADVSGYVSSIAVAAKQQAGGLQQVNAAVNEMDGVTQQNAAMVEETNAAVRSLASEADGLARRVAGFKLAKGDRQDGSAERRASPARAHDGGGARISRSARRAAA